MKNIKFDSKPLMKVLHEKLKAGFTEAAAFAAEKAKEGAPVRTGKLKKKHIKSKVIAKKLMDVRGYVLTNIFYGRMQELGTSKMAAQPFLRPSVENNKEEIMRRIAGG